MIQWEVTSNKLPVKAWCVDRDEGTVRQAENLANHPALRERVCLMPDAHVGKRMPIGMGEVVFDRFHFQQSKFRRKGQQEKRLYDLSEAPLAYKDIDTVIAAESDLVKPLVKLSPLAVVKG